jgi:hypothetical protein
MGQGLLVVALVGLGTVVTTAQGQLRQTAWFGVTLPAPPGKEPAVISTPGLKRIARFFAYLVKEVGRARARQINP